MDLFLVLLAAHLWLDTREILTELVIAQIRALSNTYTNF